MSGRFLVVSCVVHEDNHDLPLCVRERGKRKREAHISEARHFEGVRRSVEASGVSYLIANVLLRIHDAFDLIETLIQNERFGLKSSCCTCLFDWPALPITHVSAAAARN